MGWVWLWVSECVQLCAYLFTFWWCLSFSFHLKFNHMKTDKLAKIDWGTKCVALCCESRCIVIPLSRASRCDVHGRAGSHFQLFVELVP